MNKTGYYDELIEIGPAQVRVKHYYLNGSDKLVNIPDIEWVSAKRASVMNGKLRFWGTGNFRTWFASDFARPTRDTIFVMRLKNKWWQVGFTALDSVRAREALSRLGVLKAR